MPKLAANITLLFREVPLLERIGAAADAGFRAIECLWPYEIPAERFRAELDRHGLDLALINTPLGPSDDPHFGLLAFAGREADFVASFDAAFRYGTAVGARAIHVMAGAWPQTPQNHATAVANLRAVASRAETAGVTLCLEPINARDRPDWFLKSSAQALAILDEVGSSAVKLQFDTYHLQILEGDLIRRLEGCIGRVGHVQIGGVPERHEPDEGEVDIHAVLDALDRLGYDRYVGCEYNPRGATIDGLGWATRYGVVSRGPLN